MQPAGVMCGVGNPHMIEESMVSPSQILCLQKLLRSVTKYLLPPAGVMHYRALAILIYDRRKHSFTVTNTFLQIFLRSVTLYLLPPAGVMHYWAWARHDSPNSTPHRLELQTWQYLPRRTGNGEGGWVSFSVCCCLMLFWQGTDYFYVFYVFLFSTILHENWRMQTKILSSRVQIRLFNTNAV